MSLILIEKIEVDGIDTYFYDGIDFSMIKSHKGENGFLIFFVENYVSEIKKYERQNKLDSILEGTHIEKFDWDDYRSDYVAIYQTSGNLIPIYKSIREKILDTTNSVFPYKIIGS